jgi:hypothetical protein
VGRWARNPVRESLCSLRREDRDRTGLADRFADPSRLPRAAHRPVSPKVKHI